MGENATNVASAMANGIAIAIHRDLTGEGGTP
jgi:hypothetical protein